MLTLSRKTDEAILIGSDIRIVIKRVDGEIVKIGIGAPKNMPIYREEVFARVGQENREALARALPDSDTGAELRLKWPKATGGEDAVRAKDV
jgi:carbon storage regulator